jgi:hypothetical protein
MTDLRRCLTCRSPWPPSALDVYGDCPECQHTPPIHIEEDEQQKEKTKSKPTDGAPDPAATAAPDAPGQLQLF